MGLLTDSRDFFTPAQAAEYLTKRLNEKVESKEVLQLAIEKRLQPSIKLIGYLNGTQGELLEKKPIEQEYAYCDSVGSRWRACFSSFHDHYMLIATHPIENFLSNSNPFGIRVTKRKEKLAKENPYTHAGCFSTKNGSTTTDHKGDFDFLTDKISFYNALEKNDNQLQRLEQLKDNLDKLIIKLAKYEKRLIDFDTNDYLFFDCSNRANLREVPTGIYKLWLSPDIQKNLAYYEYSKGNVKPDIVILCGQDFISLKHDFFKTNDKFGFYTRDNYSAGVIESIETKLTNYIIFGFDRMELEQFIENLIPFELDLEKREKRTLAKTITALAQKAKIDLSVPTKAAKDIQAYGDTQGLEMPSWQTILKWIELANNHAD